MFNEPVVQAVQRKDPAPALPQKSVIDERKQALMEQ